MLVEVQKALLLYVLCSVFPHVSSIKRRTVHHGIQRQIVCANIILCFKAEVIFVCHIPAVRHATKPDAVFCTQPT